MYPPVTYGGTLQTPEKVQLSYVNKSGQWSGVTFPDIKSTEFQQLLESSKATVFHGQKGCPTDKSYCIYILEPDRFMTSFQLSDTSILGKIQMLEGCIAAKLCQLNICTVGGCFRGLDLVVEPPPGHYMFGTLL